jgi:hypothetical protein
MYKDDKYCRRLTAWNDLISRDFDTILAWFLQTADEREAFRFNKENHLQPILSFLETALNKVNSFRAPVPTV